MTTQSTSMAAAPSIANGQTSNNAEPTADTNTQPSIAATPQQAAKQKLKIRDLEMDEEAAYREIQRGRQSSKLLTEAQKRAMAAEQKEAALAQKQSKYKEDLGAFFEDMGLDEETAAQLAADYIYKKQILPQEMTPEQKRVMELEQKLSALETEKLTQKEAQEKAEREWVIQQESQKLQQELVEAAKAGKIPSTQYGMRKIAAKMLELESRGLSVPLEQVAAVVREESGREFGEIASNAEISDLREWLGDKNFKVMSKRILDYFLGQISTQKQKPSVRTQQVNGKAPERMTPEEFLRKIEGRK